MAAWRLLDTGLRPAAENIAFNRALLEARQAGEGRPTLRFLQFRPAALLGYHQSAGQELDLGYCREHGIEVQRRVTGGGAIYMDEGQLGWELYLTKAELGTADMEIITRRICEAAAKGVAALGAPAAFRPRNDIEVGGRKISGTGGAFDGDALMYQGTLLVDFDVERMLRVLRVSAEKLSDKAIASARERVTCLRELLGTAPPLGQARAALQAAFAREFGVDFEAGALSPGEQARYEAALAEIARPEWVDMIARPASDLRVREAVRKFPGGLVRASVTLDTHSGRIRQVWFSGDFFVQPRRLVADLEAWLKDSHPDDLEWKTESFFAGRPADMLGLRPFDFTAVLEEALTGMRPSGAARGD